MTPGFVAALAALLALTDRAVLRMLAKIPPVNWPVIMAAVVTVSTSRATALADLGVGQAVEVQARRPVPPLAIPPAGVGDRVEAAVLVVSQSAPTASPIPDDQLDDWARQYLAEAERVGGPQAEQFRLDQARLRRIAREETLHASSNGAARALKGHGVTRWQRVSTGPRTCPACAHYVAKGPTSIDPERMWRHTGCDCVPMPAPPDETTP
jgi:hypothetical protein